MATVTLYHRTGTDNANTIMTGGFVNGEGKYGLDIDEPIRGVFLSDRPLDANEGAFGDALLAVEIDEALIDDYDLKQ